MLRRRLHLLALLWAVACLAACVPGTPFSAPHPGPSLQAPAPPRKPAPLQPGAAIRFQQISIEEGLSNSVVTSIVQDQAGFLWLGTSDGLNRYDGYTFNVYRPNPTDPNSLSDGWINALLADADGSLWIGTRQGGLNHYDARTGNFTRYQSDPEDDTSLADPDVTALYRDSHSTLWVGTAKGLDRFDPSSKTFTHFVNDTNNPSSLSDDHVTSIVEDSAGRLWVGTYKGLNLYRAADGSFGHYMSAQNDPNTLSNDRVCSLKADAQGSLWVATERGLNRFNAQTGTFTRYLNDPNDTTSLGTDSINALQVDSEGILWIAGTAGLDRYDPATRQFLHYRMNPLVQDSLSVDVLYSAYEDREGVLWFGTWGGGVNKYDRTQNQFGFYRNDPADPQSLRSGGVFPIFADNDGTAWIGVYGSGLERFDPSTGTFKHYDNDPKDSNSLNSQNVWKILRDRQGVLWLGTSQGLDEFDAKNGRFIHHLPAPDEPANTSLNAVQGLHEDRAGNLWIGTGQGLARFDRQTGKFVSYGDPSDEDHATPVNVSHISEDRSGNLWLSTTMTGLYYFDVKTETFKHYTHDPKSTGSLTSNIVLWTYPDAQNMLWIATAGGGINKYDPAADAFTFYTDENGLPNNFVYCILPDEQGYLWFSTNYGLSRFDPLKKTFQNYTVDDGLQSNEHDSNACARAADGSLYFGGLMGFNHFSPKDIRANSYQPPVVITALTQDGNALPGTTAPEASRDITLKWPQNSFEFEFSALTFSQPKSTQYGYKLDGFDAGWVPLGTQRDGRYTNLPGGEYVLRLRASNRGGAWTESAQPIRVTVIPPFWQMWWFIGLSALLIVTIILGAYRLRVHSIEAQKNELERQVKERTLEIEKLFEQTRELAIIEERNRLARELHDSAKQKAFAALAQLGTATGLIQHNVGAARTHIGEAENLVSDVIQELTFLIQEMYPLALQEKGLATALRDYVFEWENRTDIRVNIQIENERRLPLQMEQALYRILQESMANIARHSHATQVEIRVTYEPDRVGLLVSDNGHGFDPGQKPKGIGLRSIQERAESVGGKVTIESAPGQGTRVEVTISIGPA